MVARRLAGAAAIALTLAGAAAGPGAAADTPAASDLTVEFSSYGPPILGLGSPLTVGVTIANDSGSDVANVDAILSLTAEPLADRAALAEWESGAATPTTREVARRAVLGSGVVAAQTTVTASVVAPALALGLGADPWAVYGVGVVIQVDGTDVKSFRTTATYLAMTPSVTPLAIAATAAGAPERVSAVVSAASAARVSLLVDPTALAQATDAVIPSSTDLYSLPAGHVDVASLARALDTSVLSLALDASTQSEAIGADRPWVAVLPSLDRASVQLAQSLGASAILVQPGTAPAGPDSDDDSAGVAPAVLDAGGGAPLIVAADPGLSVALAGTHVSAALRPAAVVAESALLAKANAEGRAVVASPGTSWMLDSDHRSAALEALAACPWIRLVTLGSVVEAGATGDASVPDAGSDEADIPGGLVATAAQHLRDLGYLAAATSGPAEVYDAPAATLLAALSFEGRGDPAARVDTVARALTAAEDVLGKVSLPHGSDLNLISTSGSVPITVTNDLDVEATVTVVLETRSSNLRPGRAVAATLAPRTSESVLIPVTAVSSANVAAFVHLTDADGHRLTPDTIVRVRVRADWGAAFTRIVGGAAFLLLVGGIWRTARRGRRDTRSAPGAEPPPLEGEV